MNKSKPIIVSASRATDIPAFYGDWFMDKLERGHCSWINPFNGKKKRISFENLRLIVFWTKNPEPFIKYLNRIDEMGYNYYFLYTLNDYEEDGLEPNLPSLESRIKSFKKLSTILGKEKVLWRFDPLILTEKIDINNLINKINRVGERIQKYTKRLIFSYADIEKYNSVKKNLRQKNISYIKMSKKDKHNIAKKISELNKNWHLEINTCAEDVELERYGIYKGKCIDDKIMINCFYEDKKLMEYLGVSKKFNINSESPKNLKDRGQRKECKCIESKDIGQYETCMHLCYYCYANKNPKKVKHNLENHNYHLDTIC
ncbi:MAG: DUF1848 domain-containing protein [Candidatus Mcinerneyibacterium aminivorans]|uniref:DUF1848 domain-containing protein n=1 Tax=Candidatus Mcinerneyibacterium aminivorans TaxID=2703815 RepID=A0A5D0MD78_9BACT|nr:MAG: DUF1848 domain-containing protein [Candidatus Mcinerneyibacterium aminivorans]